MKKEQSFKNALLDEFREQFESGEKEFEYSFISDGHEIAVFVDYTVEATDKFDIPGYYSTIIVRKVQVFFDGFEDEDLEADYESDVTEVENFINKR